MYQKNNLSDTTIYLIIFLISLCLIIGLTVFVVWSIVVSQRRKNAYEGDLIIAKHNYEQEILKSQIEIHEEVFQRISSEIHDNIGQFIVLAKLELSILTEDTQKTTEEKLAHIQNILSQALNDLRDLSKSLSSDYIRQAGLKSAVQLLVEQLRKTNKFGIDFKISGTYKSGNEEIEIVVFRILQESINNIITHSKADKISIQLDFADEEMRLIIHDNGRGFDPEYAKNQVISGSGLRNMKKRSILINAKLEIDSKKEFGTFVSLKVPMMPIGK